MKKLALLLICAGLVVCLTACGTEAKSDEPSATVVEQTQTPEVPDEKESESLPVEEETVANEYEGYVKISGQSIYVNYKNGRSDDVRASAIVFNSTDSDLTVLAYETDEPFSGDKGDALALLNDGRILDAIYVYSDADFHDFDYSYVIDVESTEDVTVNGYEMLKFVGSVRSSDDIDCYVYGYTFVVNDIPCMIAGLVVSEGQEESLITEIQTEVDTMVGTVRTKR